MNIDLENTLALAVAWAKENSILLFQKWTFGT